MAQSRQLVLASSSRYRRELLERLGLHFKAASPQCDETPLAGEAAPDTASRLSILKARSLQKRFPDALIIGADQVAVALLDARKHQIQSRVVPCRVFFRKLNEKSIEAYLRREQPYDCAASAKAEGLGIALIERIETEDPTSLIGLPLIALTEMLEHAGLPVL